MVAVKLAELKDHADEIVRRLQETGEPVEILDGGRVVAKLVPLEEDPPSQEELESFWTEFDQLSEEISADWPEGVSAVDAIRDVRRDL